MFFRRSHSNFVIAFTVPAMIGAFTPQGAFGWFAGWNVIGFVLILLFVPETKALSLEELDQGRYHVFLHVTNANLRPVLSPL